MAINFNSLPSNSPSLLPPKGQYFAKIVSAEMKSPKPDSTGKIIKPDYLNYSMTITDMNGKSYGKIFDMISESDSDIIRYKLRRFVEAALGVTLTGTFELKDLCKIAPNKEFIVDIGIQSDKNGQYPDKAVVDVFSGQIFYPLSDAERIFGENVTAPFDASDATDAQTANGDTFI